MAPFTTSHYFKALTFTILFLKALAFDPTPLFSFVDFEKGPKFKSNVTLYGNAKFVNGGSGIHFSGSGSPGTGRVMYKKPIKVFEGKPKQLVSFSTYFAFSTSMDDRGGLAFVMVPNGSKNVVFDKSSSGYPLELKNRNSRVVSVEFSASRGSKNGISSTTCHVSINVNSVPAKVNNTSLINLGVRIGGKFHAWIDYEASSRRLEVRLTQNGKSKPSDPILWHSIDLSNVLNEKEMFVGFSPAKGNASSKSCFLYSWSFVLRHFPHSLHSEPMDPKVKKSETLKVVEQPRSDCVLRVLAAMIFGTGCGALTAFILLYFWTIFGNRRPVAPEECVMQMQPVDAEYRKVKIVVDRSVEDGRK